MKSTNDVTGYGGVKRQSTGSVSRGHGSRLSSGSQYSGSLLDAIRSNRVDTALSLIAQGADPNCIDPSDGRSVLQIAVESGGNIGILKELLRAGASPNKSHQHTGHTTLHVAARKGYQVCVRALLNAGADVDAQDSSGQTPLMAALQAGHSLVATELLGAGCDVNAANGHGERALHVAAKGGHVTEAEELVNYGANVNLPDNRNQTAFYLACKGQQVELASFLARQGSCDVNVQESQTGRTPLHWAVEQGNKDLVRLLVQRGANPNVGDKDWNTPFLLALDRGQRDIALYLLSKTRCDVIAMNRLSNTALHVAARDGHVDLLDQFVAKGQDVNVKGPCGSTPLMVAAFEGQVDVVGRLFEHGAKVSLSDRFRATALIHAIISPENEDATNRIISRLIRANVDVNQGANLSGLLGTIDTSRWRIATQVESRMYSPLDVALLTGRNSVIAMLVKRGCTVPTSFKKMLEHQYLTVNLLEDSRDTVQTIRALLRDIRSVKTLKELCRICIFDALKHQGQEPAALLRHRPGVDRTVIQYLRFLDLDPVTPSVQNGSSSSSSRNDVTSVALGSKQNLAVPVANGYSNGGHGKLTTSASAPAFVRNSAARRTYTSGQKVSGVPVRPSTSVGVRNGASRLNSTGASNSRLNSHSSSTNINNNSHHQQQPIKSPTSKQNGHVTPSPKSPQHQQAAGGSWASSTSSAVGRPTTIVRPLSVSGSSSSIRTSTPQMASTVTRPTDLVGTPRQSTNIRMSTSSAALQLRNDAVTSRQQQGEEVNGRERTESESSSSSRLKTYKTFESDLNVWTLSTDTSPTGSVASDIGKVKVNDRTSSTSSNSGQVKRASNLSGYSPKSPGDVKVNGMTNGKSSLIENMSPLAANQRRAESMTSFTFPATNGYHNNRGVTVTVTGTNGYNHHERQSNANSASPSPSPSQLSPSSPNSGSGEPASPLSLSSSCLNSPFSPLSPTSPAPGGGVFDRPTTPRSRLPQPVWRQPLTSPTVKSPLNAKFIVGDCTADNDNFNFKRTWSLRK